jgi:subtilisin family serine protease
MMSIILLLLSLFSTAYADPNLQAILSVRKGAEVSRKDLDQVVKTRAVVKIHSLFNSREQAQLKKIKAAYLTQSWIVELRDGKSFDQLERRIRRLGLPMSLDWNDLRVTSQSEPFEAYQWALKNTGAAQELDLDPMQTYRIPARTDEDVDLPAPLKAPKKVLVAVLDTGIDKTHPDLKGVIHRNESECKALDKFLACTQEKSRGECEKIWMDPKNPEVDQDHNGYPLDCEGWSLLGGVNAANIMGRPDFGDEQGHGSHVAGIIAAQIGNGIGVRGLSSNVEILPVQVLGNQPSEPLKPLSVDMTPSENGKESYNKSLGDMVARGVIYAMLSGAKVLNFSMGWPQGRDSDFMRAVIAEAQSRGMIIVAAAGNDSTRALLRPCAYPGVICVAATGPDGALASFSNYGSGVDIAAPGVNILSTYPESQRPVRFRSTLGYEYLSGTSQATPFVVGAAAEMLARGVPSAEVYPRLIASSRPLQSNLSLLQGNARTGATSLPAEKAPYQKYLLAGQLDLKRALAATPVPVIVPAQKERLQINWDRQTRDLQLNVSLVNKWRAVATDQVQIRALFEKPHPEAVRPDVVSITPAQNYGATWNQNEERQFIVKMRISDGTSAAQSRLPSELGLSVYVDIAGVSQRKFIVEADVLVTISATSVASDISVIPLQGMPAARISFLPIDENLDDQPTQRDYLAVSENRANWQFWLLTQNNGGAYQNRGTAKIRIDGDADLLREQVLARTDIDGDGHSDYVVGVLEDKSGSDGDTSSPMSFFVFNSAMKLIKSYKYDSKIAQIPYQVYWHKIHGQKFPAWVGAGLEPNKQISLRDRWENPNNSEKPQVRFYYLENETTLKSLTDYNGYKIVDVIQPRQDQVDQGRVPVLLAKNQGTEAKPSYLYSFAVAEVYEGKIQNFMDLGLFANSETYRNILDTRVDHVYSLDNSNDEYNGSFWFGDGLNREQRLSVFNNRSLDFLDQQLGAQRDQFDSALWVRSVYSGLQRQGAFVLTNSEIEYHDLQTGQVAGTSMERYTFYPDMLMTNLYFPLTIEDSQKNNAKLPALFTTETSQLSRGVKMLVPVFARDGSLVELVSPARLRFQSGAGCRPLDTPVFEGGNRGYAFDYYCGDKILRVHLSY